MPSAASGTTRSCPPPAPGRLVAAAGVAGEVLLTAGVVVLLFVVWQLGFTAIVDQTALGRPLIVYVDIRVKPGADSLRLEQMLRGLAGAVEYTSVSGNYDYQVKLACADQDDLFKKIVKLRLQPGVQETHTRLIMGETKLSS